MFDDASDGDPGGLEALLRAAGECAEPSRGLCERIIAEAVPARAAVVRRNRRTLTGIAAVLALGLVTVVGSQSLVGPVRTAPSRATAGPIDRFGRDASAVGVEPASESGRRPSEAGEADWNLVEAEASTNRSRIALLRSALGA